MTGPFETAAEELAAELSRKAGAYGFAVGADCFPEPGGWVARFVVHRDDPRSGAYLCELCRSPWRPGLDGPEAAFEDLLSEYGSRREWRVRVVSMLFDLSLPGASSAEELRIRDAAEGRPEEATHCRSPELPGNPVV